MRRPSIEKWIAAWEANVTATRAAWAEEAKAAAIWVAKVKAKARADTEAREKMAEAEAQEAQRWSQREGGHDEQ